MSDINLIDAICCICKVKFMTYDAGAFVRQERSKENDEYPLYQWVSDTYGYVDELPKVKDRNGIWWRAIIDKKCRKCRKHIDISTFGLEAPIYRNNLKPLSRKLAIYKCEDCGYSHIGITCREYNIQKFMEMLS